MTEVLPRGIRIRNHKSGSSIQIAFSYHGNECRETLPHIKPNASGIAEAVRRLKCIRKAISDGHFDYGAEFPRSRRARVTQGIGATMTVAQLLDEYLNESKSALALSTFTAYRSMIESRLKPGLGDLRAKDLTPTHIRGWLRSLSTRGLSKKYGRNLISPLRLAYDYAADKRYVSDNPVPAKFSFNVSGKPAA